ncbi:MAG: DEAD/DEAH box helicase [Opitutales bacterium]|nr:DEAD/DEAH box helicase [Opitutales bacterium]
MSAPSGHRLVYLLDTDARNRLCVEVQLTRLLNRKSFRPAPVKRLMELMRDQFSEYLVPEDRRLLTRLAQNESHNGVALAGAEGRELLGAMVDTGRAFLAAGRGGRLRWSEPAAAQPAWAEVDGGRWKPGLDCGDGADGVWATVPPVRFGPGEKTDVVAELRVPDWPEPLAGEWLRAEPMDGDEAARFITKLVNRHPGSPVPAPPGMEMEEETVRPVPRLRILRKDTLPAAGADRLITLHDLLLARLEFQYGPRAVPWDDPRPEIAYREGAKARRVRRDTAFEGAALARLNALGFEPKPPDPAAGLFDFHKGDFILADDTPGGWETLLRKAFPDLRKEGWEVEDPPDLTLKTGTGESGWYSGFNPAGAQWFTFEAGLRHEGRRIPVIPLIRDFLVRHADEPDEVLRERFARSTFALQEAGGGACVLVPGGKIRDIFESLFELRHGMDLRGGGIRVGAWRASELALDGIAYEAPGEWDAARTARLRAWFGRNDILEPPSGLPDDLSALRAYQRRALGWMEFLRDTGTGGILADDMGLGKTFQVLAHLRRLQHGGRLGKPALVVAPVSVMDNWIREAGIRTPALRTRLHHGAGRGTIDPEAADLFVTSYGHLRQDTAVLAEVEWSAVILDEAQAIKNTASQAFAAATTLRAEHRLALSGTPVENHPGELWALMHFAIPGFLGTEEQFREFFPRGASEEAAGRARENAAWLAHRIAPFVLRRRKDDVASELPPKTEVEHILPLSDLQARAYEALRAQLNRDIRTLLERRGVAQSTVFVLDALLRLRLLCCDPRLRGEGEGKAAATDSAKLVRLLELLAELVAEGRRVLVFSQFTKMLDLIEAEIAARGWSFLRLTGETPPAERSGLVNAFNEGDAPVMLLSLKAGGTGLNLTGADTVVHYDPWWNPAVEAQATDRVHRIGQDKPVFVHRLIAEGTVEEKIRALHARKQGLVDAIIEGLPADRVTLDEETIEAFFGDTSPESQSPARNRPN